MRSLTNLLVSIILVLLAACGSPAERSSSEADSTGGADSPDAGQSGTGTEQAAPDSVLVMGKKVYDSYCLACHQADGSGVPGMYPPLTDTTWLADDEKLIGVILDGLSGTITVHGETYNQMMPTHNFLEDNEIAAVLSYVQEEFGNRKRSISPEEVKAQRGN